ncbi:nickel ABC transporter ATP-binding protein NikE [Microbacterium thalassium]|uniref:ABC-type glutathione transport system ATPase component n=1 Tax=Microbacterium thalassium TaxID=362649 RepID=A0A7X0FNK8_9MICO|nr:ABC transporter ATP-binding protein [Microbacterium thalassium]MBB6390340.1 ABC-type glutathione transport system ATPase component [Microbacterium thalassium]GLK25449.1 ABC transporter ATP-binding protein [Microbacterium thalassium]
MTNPILEVDRLDIFAPGEPEPRQLVFGSSLAVRRGEAVGLVGESGSGKTLTVRAIAGLLPDGFTTDGAIRIDGQDLSALPARAVTDLRAHRVGMIFQTPRAHLNPLRTIGDFMTEALIHVSHVKPDAARGRALELLDEVGISDPGRRMHQHPAELSGGLLQRVMIAATLAMDPEILLADEITTALDVTTQEEVMAVIADLREHRDLSLLFITHDLALAAAVCDRVSVMQHGRIVETLRAATMRQDATQEYTRTLMSAAMDEAPPLETTDADATPLLTIEKLRKTYRVRGANGGRESLVAVDDVSLRVPAGGSVGIVGESGSGKSTTARMLLGLEHPDAGTITVQGQDWSVPARTGKARRRRAKTAQMVFQDPYQSLDRRQTVRQCLVEAIRVHRPRDRRPAVEARVAELIAQVRLDEKLLDARPRALSGGQRQRVAIARALAAEPALLVLDEAVSALDVTTQVEILTLLDGIRRETGVTLLMITHDLTVIRRLCDEVVVMRHGMIEERGTAAEILDEPKADYTRLLLDSIPREGWKPRRRRLGRTQALPTVTRTTMIPEHPEPRP